MTLGRHKMTPLLHTTGRHETTLGRHKMTPLLHTTGRHGMTPLQG